MTTTDKFEARLPVDLMDEAEKILDGELTNKLFGDPLNESRMRLAEALISLANARMTGRQA